MTPCPSSTARPCAVEELEAIAPPDIKVVEFETGSPLVFEVTVDVRPDIELPDLDADHGRGSFTRRHRRGHRRATRTPPGSLRRARDGGAGCPPGRLRADRPQGVPPRRTHRGRQRDRLSLRGGFPHRAPETRRRAARNPSRRHPEVLARVRRASWRDRTSPLRCWSKR